MFFKPTAARPETAIIPTGLVTLHADHGDYAATILDINYDTCRAHVSYLDFYTKEQREAWVDLGRLTPGWPGLHQASPDIARAADGDYAGGFCHVRGQVGGKLFVEGILTDGSVWFDRVSKIKSISMRDSVTFVEAWNAVTNAKAAVAAEATTAA